VQRVLESRIDIFIVEPDWCLLAGSGNTAEFAHIRSRNHDWV